MSKPIVIQSFKKTIVQEYLLFMQQEQETLHETQQQPQQGKVLTYENSNCFDILHSPNDLVMKAVVKSKYSTILQQLKKYGENFIDDVFQHKDYALKNSHRGGKVVWKRVHEFIPNAQFINDSINPADVIQGQLGNCYFLSAIAALAQKPQRLRICFPDLQIHPQGIYMVRLLHKGIIQQVVVDDYFPLNAKTGKVLYAKPNNGRQIWVMILQKCWAKLFGSYQATIGGLPNQVLHTFSAAPTFNVKQMPSSQKGLDSLFQKMLQTQKEGGVLCCGTIGNSQIQDFGLVPRHAYTLLSIFRKPYKMVKIRNPWGSFQWNGHASQSDHAFWNSISPQDKKMLGYQKKDDGTFFMLWENFINVYDMIDMCFVDDGASYLHIESVMNSPCGELFEVQILTEGKFTLCISQQNLRRQDNPQYAQITCLAGRYVDPQPGYQFKFQKMTSNKLVDSYIEMKAAKPGKYYFLLMVDYPAHTQHKSLTVGVYSPIKFTLKKVEDERYSQSFIHQCLLDQAREDTIFQEVVSENPRVWVAKRYYGQKKGGIGYVAINLDPKSHISCQVTIEQNEFKKNGFRLLPPYEGHQINKTVLQPGFELILIFKKLPPGIFSPSSFSIPTPVIQFLN